MKIRRFGKTEDKSYISILITNTRPDNMDKIGFNMSIYLDKEEYKKMTHEEITDIIQLCFVQHMVDYDASK